MKNTDNWKAQRINLDSALVEAINKLKPAKIVCGGVIASILKDSVLFKPSQDEIASDIIGTFDDVPVNYNQFFHTQDPRILDDKNNVVLELPEEMVLNLT
jgi:hypothetical protein